MTRNLIAQLNDGQYGKVRVVSPQGIAARGVALLAIALILGFVARRRPRPRPPAAGAPAG